MRKLNQQNLSSLPSRTKSPLPIKSTRQKKQESWNLARVGIVSLLHQAEFINTIKWRQSTSMPIVRIRSFFIESQTWYPKLAEVEVQEIEKTFQNITQLELGEGLYILRETLLGLQALVSHFGTLDLTDIFCGINTKGECRIWLCRETENCTPCSNQLTNTSEMLMFAFNKVLGMIKGCYQKFFKNLYEVLTAGSEEISFAFVHKRMRQYASSRKITVPSALKVVSSNLDKNSLDPLSKSFKLKVSPLERLMKSDNLPNIGSGNKNKTFSNPQRQIGREGIFFKSTKNSHDRMPDKNSDQVIKAEIKLSRNSSKQLFLSEQISKRRSVNKISFATTHLTENTKASKDCLPEHLLRERETSSQFVDKFGKISHIKSAYNFGCLDPVPEDVTLNCGEHQIKHSESVTSIEFGMSEDKDGSEKDQMKQFWRKTMYNFLTDNKKQLKQSFHEGPEEVKIFDIELHKLGKLGRNISNSICQQNNQ